MIEEKRFAVLIDADNVSPKYIKYILDEISNYGVATYKRIYGDWTKSITSSWKDVLLENSITPVQQYGYTTGKNATDSAMIIDAMDILYSRNVEGFCIASSDSDFTKLSSRLRESGMFIIGMGEKKTPKAFISACNEFKFLDVIAETDKKSLEIAVEPKHSEIDLVKKSEVKLEHEIKHENGAKNKPNNNQENIENGKNMTDISVINSAIIKMMNEIDEETQMMNIAELGNRLVKRYPDFDVRNYGFNKLSKFLRQFTFLKIESKGKNGIWVSLKDEVNSTQSTIVTKDVKKRRKNNPKRKEHTK